MMVDATARGTRGSDQPAHNPDPQEHTVARSTRRRSPEEIAERADRILDAAGELLVSWGYRKITIEDVARRAGVGKGTVYLHFPTKEVLFFVVLMRVQTNLGRTLVADMAARPEAILPHAQASALYRELERSPILHALFTSDTEVLGTVVEVAAHDHTDLFAERIRTLESYFRLLSEHHLVRTDLSPQELLHTYGSITAGALFYPPLLERQKESHPALGRERQGELLADSVRRALEEPHSEQALHQAWPQVTALFDHLVGRARTALDHYRTTIRRDD